MKFITFNKDYSFNCFSNEKSLLSVEIAKEEFEMLSILSEESYYSIYYFLPEKDYRITRPPFPNSKWNGSSFKNTVEDVNASLFFEEKINTVLFSLEKLKTKSNFINENKDVFSYNGLLPLEGKKLNFVDFEAACSFINKKYEFLNSKKNVKDFNELKNAYRHLLPSKNGIFIDKTVVEKKKFLAFYKNFHNSIKNCCFEYTTIDSTKVSTNGIHFGILPKKIDNKPRYDLDTFYNTLKTNGLFIPILLDERKGNKRVVEGNHRVCAYKAKNDHSPLEALLCKDFINEKGLTLTIDKEIYNTFFKELCLFNCCIIEEVENNFVLKFNNDLITLYVKKYFCRDLFIIVSEFINKHIEHYKLHSINK